MVGSSTVPRRTHSKGSLRAKTGPVANVVEASTLSCRCGGRPVPGFCFLPWQCRSWRCVQLTHKDASARRRGSLSTDAEAGSIKKGTSRCGDIFRSAFRTKSRFLRSVDLLPASNGRPGFWQGRRRHAQAPEGAPGMQGPSTNSTCHGPGAESLPGQNCAAKRAKARARLGWPPRDD
jgi:hypothetical protein